MLLIILLIVILLAYGVPGGMRPRFTTPGYRTGGDMLAVVLTIVLIVLVLRALALI